MRDVCKDYRLSACVFTLAEQIYILIASDINTTKGSLAIRVWLRASYIVHIRYMCTLRLSALSKLQDNHLPVVFCLKAFKI